MAWCGWESSVWIPIFVLLVSVCIILNDDSLSHDDASRIYCVCSAVACWCFIFFILSFSIPFHAHFACRIYLSLEFYYINTYFCCSNYFTCNDSFINSEFTLHENANMHQTVLIFVNEMNVSQSFDAVVLCHCDCSESQATVVRALSWALQYCI